MNKMKTFYIRTYGCQMNELDSEVVVGILEQRGLIKSDDEINADIIIFNTCSIRDLAERKVMGKIGQLCRKIKKNTVLGIMGCMASSKKDSLFKKLPRLNFVIGTNNINDLNDVLDEILNSGKQISQVQDKPEDPNYALAHRENNISAYVSIIRGCNNFCTYCVVPYTRGRETSRKPQDIIEECKKITDNGTKEITLLGQNVNSYGKEHNCHFHDLLYQLDKIPNLERIRFMTSHPVDITRELMLAVHELPKVCEFVHFPIQAGSNRILKKMNRKYTKEEYLEKVRLFREICPNISLGTDIIVGFPTETEEEFEETYNIMEELEYSVAFLFAYSPRKGTPASRWEDDIPHHEKQRRLQKLLALHNKICKKQREKLVNQTVEVLVERKNEKNKNLLKGHTRCWKNVLLPGDENLIGTVQQVLIKNFQHQTLLT